MKRKRRSFSSRDYRRHLHVQLILGGLLVLLVVGGGLVWLIYGRTAALTAVLCLAVATGVIGLLWLILALLERWVGEEEP